MSVLCCSDGCRLKYGTCNCFMIVLQSRLRAHVRNVQLFHELLGVQVDWLTEADRRLATLRRASKVFAHVQQQLDSFQVSSDLCFNHSFHWHHHQRHHRHRRGV